jgi:hypothetical protein
MAYIMTAMVRFHIITQDPHYKNTFVIIILIRFKNLPGPHLITHNAYALDESVKRVLVFAWEAAVYLCFVTTGANRVAEIILVESFGE